MSAQFNEFLNTVDSRYQLFVTKINDLLMLNKCKCNIKPAKNGFLVSYLLNKKTVASFVARKSGMKLRIYPKSIVKHEDFLNSLPAKMKKEIKKASVCKRLIDPEACNPKCVMGYDFMMDNEHFQKCRYMAFTFTLSEESNPYIKTFLEQVISSITVQG